MSPVSSSIDSSDISLSDRMDEWISRQHTLLIVAQESQEVAQQNEQEFMVRDIIAHRGNHHRRSSMEFLVRWTGYDAML